MTSAEIAWIPASSSLTSGAFLLGFGRLCDLLGRKTVLLTSLACLTFICLGTGFSNSPITLLVLNGLVGTASASAIVAALGILGAAYSPSKRKNYAFACFSAGNPLGFVFGMLVGGIATQLANWRATFWTLAVIFLITTLIAAYATPVDSSEKNPLSKETFLKFDLIGILLTIVGVAMISAGLTEGSDAGWGTSYIIVLLVLGVLAMVGFVFWELRYKYPLVPMSVWRDRNFSLLNIILVLGFLGFPIALFWTALFLQRVWQLSPLSVAVHLLPAAVSGTLVNVVAGLILHKVSNKLLMGIGALAYTVAFVLLAQNTSTSSYWAFIFPGLAIMVVGADFEFNCCNMYIMSSRPSSEQSVSGGILQTGTKLCSTIGFGIATALFNATRGPAPPPGDQSTDGRPPVDPSHPYQIVFYFCVACTALSVFFVPFLTINTQGKAPAKPIGQKVKRRPSAAPGD